MFMHRTRYDRAIEAIEDARAKCEEAQEKYSKGDGVTQLNRAQRELADAYDRAREISGSRVHDPR